MPLIPQAFIQGEPSAYQWGCRAYVTSLGLHLPCCEIEDWTWWEKRKRLHHWFDLWDKGFSGELANGRTWESVSHDGMPIFSRHFSTLVGVAGFWILCSSIIRYFPQTACRNVTAFSSRLCQSIFGEELCHFEYKVPLRFFCICYYKIDIIVM